MGFASYSTPSFILIVLPYLVTLFVNICFYFSWQARSDMIYYSCIGGIKAPSTKAKCPYRWKKRGNLRRLRQYSGFERYSIDLSENTHPIWSLSVYSADDVIGQEGGILQNKKRYPSSWLPIKSSTTTVLRIRLRTCDDGDVPHFCGTRIAGERCATTSLLWVANGGCHCL